VNDGSDSEQEQDREWCARGCCTQSALRVLRVDVVVTAFTVEEKNVPIDALK
jgi:hypothetical protein